MHSARAKVLQTLCGKPMLWHVLDAAAKLQPDQIHVVYGHLGEQVRANVARWPNPYASGLHWVLQAKQGGTGDALAHAMPHIPDGARVLVLYGDSPALSDATLQRLVAQPGFAALIAQVAQPGSLGRVTLESRERDGTRVEIITRITEAKDADAQTLALQTVNTGLLIGDASELRRHLASLKPNNSQLELYLTDVFAASAAEQHPAQAVLCADEYEGFGANDAWELAQLERYLQQRLVRALCQQGLRVADPQRVDIRGSVSHGRDVDVDVNVIFEGNNVVGDDVSIGPFTRIKDCNLGAGTVVLGHCDLDGVVTTGPCKIGPFARLRPGTELAEGVHIGNFVETKKARLGKASKANHLSYLGDAEIGAGVNIGAGTITCNYDGVNKFQTTIEDGVFVGSNSSLVAPITLGKNATIGAGSTLSKDAPANQLTVARSKATSVPGWTRPLKK